MPKRPSVARDAERRLKREADPSRAQFFQRFFKTAPGQYAHGDRFLGLSVPQVRALATEYQGLPLAEIDALLSSQWHEVRLLALILLIDAYAAAGEPVKKQIYRLYLQRTDFINNWDLVDASAAAIVGAHLHQRARSPLRRLARSKKLWERRIAMVATYHFIRHHQFDDAVEIAEMLLDDGHDLMHKAVGWMLREVGKRDESVLTHFLDRHADRMPRTSLRYAIERLSPLQKKHYMAIGRTKEATDSRLARSRSRSRPSR